MDLENMTWSEIVVKLEAKFQKRFGLNLSGAAQTYGGHLIFSGGRLKIIVSDSYEKNENEYCISSYFSMDNLSSIVNDLEKLFLIGLRSEELKNKQHKQNLEKVKAFLEKGF